MTQLQFGTRFASLLSAMVLLTSCNDDVRIASTPAPLEVNIQVTGATNLESMMDELERRGLTATVWLSAEEMDDRCAYIGTLASRGHEIAGKYPGSIEADTSYQVQKAELESMLEVSQRCTGKRMAGFRATRFTSNDDTHQLLDELEIPYMVRSNRAVLLSVYTFRPYRLEGHAFSVLPMPLAVYYGETSSLCDTATAGSLTPEQLLTYEKASLDHNLRLQEPLVIEWHPELTHPGNDACWGTFVGTLDYMQSKGSRIRAATAKAIVERYPATHALSPGVPELEESAAP
jgi:hypothetical protein